MMKISVVIPAFNAGKNVRALLESLYTAEQKPEELILVDDCSQELMDWVCIDFPIKLLRLSTNSGPAAARNRGAAEANGEIIFFLDSDVTVFSDTLANVYKHFEKHPEDVFVNGVCDKFSKSPGLFPDFLALTEYFTHVVSSENTATLFTPRVGAIRKKTFEELGGFDTRFKTALIEDYEFSRRIPEKYHVTIDRNIMVRHDYSPFNKYIKTFIPRIIAWVNLFLTTRKFDNYGATTKKNSWVVLFSILAIGCIPLLPIFPTVKIFIPLCLLVCVYIMYPYVKFIVKHKGFAFALYSFMMYTFLLALSGLLCSITFPYYLLKKR